MWIYNEKSTINPKFLTKAGFLKIGMHNGEKYFDTRCKYNTSNQRGSTGQQTIVNLQ